jgi:sirohydrochlorin ferrochelatase
MATPKQIQNKRPGPAPASAILSLPFVARQKEIARLSELHAELKHALILGPAGVGKSALVAHLRDSLALLVSPGSEHWGEICDGLEPQLGLAPAEMRLLERKQRLREALRGAGRTVVFDGVGWTTPKLSSFFERIAEGAPVWICARSEHSWDIGHFWPLLVRFERVELRPFHLSETQELVEAAVKAGIIPAEAGTIVEWLHRRSGGSPLVLRQLFEELATSKYDLSNSYALRRLDLDRRIHEIFPLA